MEKIWFQRLTDLLVIIQPLSRKATVNLESVRLQARAPPHRFPVMLPQWMGQPLLVELKHVQGGQHSEQHGKSHNRGQRAEWRACPRLWESQKAS